MKYKVMIIIAAVILLVGVGGSVLVLNMPHSSLVQIKQDGRVVRTVDLAAARDEVFTLRGHGGSNTIEIKGGRIRVKDADCPDKICVRREWLQSSALPIVCLPHHLEIAYADSDGGADAVAQ